MRVVAGGLSVMRASSSRLRNGGSSHRGVQHEALGSGPSRLCPRIRDAYRRAVVLRSTHVIAVPNLAASSAFYRDVLGFEIREMGDPGWRMFVNGGCRIMAGECPDAMPAPDTATTRTSCT